MSDGSRIAALVSRGVTLARRTACLTAMCLLSLTGIAAEPRWDLPQAAPEGFLPRLGAIKVDGDLAEWNAAAAVPLRFASYLAIRKPAHTWNGPADCGMEVLCGWNDEGLCLAGFVADDDVRNDATPENSWQQDCLELYVDGRTGESFMKPPYTKGAYQMYVRPPVGGKAAELCVNPTHGVIKGARVAGKPVAGGWTFELVLPWSAFPGYSARVGASFGLQFGLDDYDRRDAGTVQPLMMSWQAATMLFMSPQKMVKWTLVDAFPKGALTPLGTVAGIDTPSEVYESSTNTVRAAIELGRALAGQAASGVYEVKDWTGAVVAKGPVTLAKLAPPWQDSVSGGFEWTLGSAGDGVYTVEAAFADGQGAPLGVSRRSVMLTRFVSQEGRAAADEAIVRIEKADIAKLAQGEPFRAAAWLGAAACVEKLKWAAELRDRQLIGVSKRELAVRMAVLETGSLPKDCEAPFNLLALTAQPETQVVVEFPAMRAAPTQTQASVTFYWGGFPLASAWVEQFPDAETARKEFEDLSPRWWPRIKLERLKLADLPAREVQRRFSWPVPFDLAKFDPANQVLVGSFQMNFLTVLDLADLNEAHVGAAVICDSAPRAVRRAVLKWAQKTDLPVMDFQRAATNTWFLMAGMPTGSNDVERLQPLRKQVSRAVRYDGWSWITVLDGSRSIAVQGNREIAAAVVRLIKDGNPVTAAEADVLRKEVLRSIPKPTVTPAAAPNMNLYSGDVHVHSGYSDGSSTPVGMAFAAMYCGMDFVVLTDHNTVDGAQVASRLFLDCGFEFPVVVGQEVTMSWAHLNAYPLREVIPANLPPYATIRAAHAQGAVIQWNHPGGYDRDWYLAHGDQAMRDTGLDAWEHPMPQYNQWKKEGRLPTLVGSTDTHGATYGESERTLILAPSPAAEDVAEAVRRKAVLLVNCTDRQVFLGTDDMIARAVAALADGPAQMERRAARIKAALAKADIPALLRRSPAAVVKPADVKP